MKVYFVTTNKFKIKEITNYFNEDEIKKRYNVELCIVKEHLQEILHEDIKVIIRAKALEAYRLLGIPCVVEHGGIFMDALPGLPGGLGQIIWNSVGDRVCDFLGEKDKRTATARSYIGYCDGKRIHIYVGETQGQITKRSRGNYEFNWDPIFIPKGSKLTYGQMGPERKQQTSQAVKAWNNFLDEGLEKYQL